MGILRDKRTSPSPSPTSTSPCADLRNAYNNCFNRWYAEKFVKGQWQKEECVVEWEKYRECLSQHLEDKQLSRFLEVEANKNPFSVDRINRKSSVDGASMGDASSK
ncbi:uncharacterized protein At4g33100-like [Chenopodium quinoa]|uniref:uncharacterized protein At4g33100-like n=1 Tax=Chenopodium quinoa TaxID=63459 RepID=UPI000B76BBF4|nr:uncharacterized protein At4g33100-like [Chenopodium quinoa]XP_021744240.1 uncharacterized protein At4g33100-like [Chenopodium quinoa]